MSGLCHQMLAPGGPCTVGSNVQGAGPTGPVEWGPISTVGGEGVRGGGGSLYSEVQSRGDEGIPL